MEFSKKKLLSIIKESQDIEFDEMAFKPENPEMPHRPKIYDPEFEYSDDRTRKFKKAQTDPKTGTIKIKKFLPGWTKDNTTPPKGEGIPDYWVVNVEGVMGQEKVWIPTNCQEIEEFVEKNREWVDQLRAKFNIEPLFEKCENPQYQTPVEKRFDPNLLAKKSEPWAAGERAQRQSGGKREEGFNNLLKKFITDNTELKEHLELCSIPPVSNARTNVDRHSEKTNTSFTFRTHHIDYYKDQEEFLDVVVGRVFGENAEQERRKDPTKFIQRQYNKSYTNWDPERKTDKKFFGYTPVYKREKKGYKESDIDVMVVTNFEIVGTMVDNGFVWNLNFKTKFGKKLKEDPRVKQLTDDKDISLQKFADVGDKEFNDRHTILDDVTIKSALLELLTEFVEKVKEFSPQDALDLANIKGYQVSDDGEDEINEQKINNIIQNVISEMRK